MSKPTFEELERRVQKLERDNMILENVLFEHKERFKTLTQNSTCVILLLSPDYKILDFNIRAEKLYGRNREDVLGLNYLETFLPEKERPVVAANIKKVLDGIQTKNFEYEVIASDGSTHLLRWNVDRVLDIQGYPTGIIAIGIDITKQKQIEMMAKESKERLDSFMNSATDSFYLLDSYLNLIEINEAGLKITGRKKEEVIGKNIADIVPGIKESGRYDKHMEVIKTGKPFIIEDHPSHSVLKSFKVGGGLGIIATDITEFKKTELEIKEKNVFLANIIKSLPYPFYVIDANDYTIQLANSAAKIFESAEFGTCYALIYGRNKPCTGKNHVCPLMEVKKKKKSVTVEHTHYDENGKSCIYEVHGYPIFDHEGNITQMIGSLIDVTERKRTEEALRESEEKYRMLIENIPSVAWRTKRNGETTYISPNIKNIYGFSDREIMTKGEEIWFKRIHPEDVDEVKKCFDSLFTRGIKFDIEYRIKRKDGKWIWLHDRSETVIKKNGEQTAYGIFSDITERKRFENIDSVFNEISKAILITDNIEELIPLIHESLSNIIDTTNFYLALYDKERNKISFPYFIDEKDKSSEEIDADHPDSLTASVIKTRKPFLYKPGEKRISRIRKGLLAPEAKIWLGVPLIVKDEVIGAITVQSYTDPQLYSERDIELIEAVSNQIAVAIERKRAEEAIKESERLFRNAIEAADAVPYYLNYKDNCYDFVGDGVEKLTGYSREEFTPHIWKSMIKELFVFGELKGLSTEEALERMRKRKELRWRADLRMELQDNQEKWFADAAIPVRNKKGEIIGTLGILQDITERKMIEKDLQGAKERAELYLNAASVIIVIIDVNEKVILINENGCEKLDYKESEIIGKNWFNNFLPVYNRKRLKKFFKEVLSGKIDLNKYYENPVITKKGEERMIAWYNTVLKDENGKIYAICSAGEDITERKNMMTALEESEQKYRTLVEEGNDGIVIVSDGIIQFANMRFLELFGYTKEKILGAPFSEYITPGEREKVFNYYRRRLAEEIVPQIYDTILIDNIGRKVDVEVNSSKIIYQGKPAVLAFIRDIKERKKAEEALHIVERASRLASLGTLAAGIAHEVNQPLTALKLRVDGMLYWSEHDPESLEQELIEGLHDISEQSERIGNIIKHMRELTYQGKAVEPVSIEVNEVIKKAISLIKKQLYVHNVRVEMNPDNENPQILGHPAMLERVIINLVLNAMHALDKVDKKNKKVNISTKHEKKNCIIEIADNGPGIPVKFIDKIFDPFFTTKDVGEGMGIGLSIIQNIVTGLSGTIKALNRKEGGAVFTVLFPLYETNIGEEK